MQAMWEGLDATLPWHAYMLSSSSTLDRPMATSSSAPQCDNACLFNILCMAMPC